MLDGGDGDVYGNLYTRLVVQLGASALGSPSVPSEQHHLLFVWKAHQSVFNGTVELLCPITFVSKITELTSELRQCGEDETNMRASADIHCQTQDCESEDQFESRTCDE